MKTYKLILSICFIAIVLVGCASVRDEPEQIESTPATTATPEHTDPCNDEGETKELLTISDFGKEFDDTFTLAQATPRDSLPIVILEMQATHREYEAWDSYCFKELKRSQERFMSDAIKAMTSFMGGTDEDTIKTQFNNLRDSRSRYEQALADAQGIEYVPPTAVPTKVIETVIVPTSTPSPVTAVAKRGIYILLGPSPGYPAIDVLEEGMTANVTGMSADKMYLQIEMLDSPGAPGWILAEMVTVTGDASSLDIVDAPKVLSRDTETPE